ncbi:MAG: chemotaxis protein CheW [Phycisphaerales bacterium]|nr:chemotaxis protein CheW [Phycisphaerales bacterium]
MTEPTNEAGSGSPADPRRAMRRLLERDLDDVALAENTRLVGHRHETVQTDELTALIVRIGGEWLGFDALFAGRVHDPGVARRVPHRHAEHLAGIVAVDGEIVPAARLDRLLDLTADAVPPDPRLVIVGPVDRRWAIPVDEVEGMVRIPRADVVDSPATVAGSLNRHTIGLLPLGDRHAALLDSDRILDLLDGGLR